MRFLTSRAVSATALLLLPRAVFCIEANAATCCDALKAAGLENRILSPDSTTYVDRIVSYWSTSNHLSPWCIVQPENTQEVAAAVEALAATETCKFAVRSGGHTPWAGSNNINDGVTIDLGNMKSTTYHAENSTVSIQPGARWRDVYGTLDKIGIAVAGGRAATVGVGGLITGGGNSFYSAKKGFVCDNVVRFEVVLASGETVIADKENYPDLFVVLKGGSFNFGIVTRFDLEAFPSTKIWGGVVVYLRSAGAQLLDAMVNFANNVANDRASSSIVFWTYMAPMGDSVVVAAYENVDGVVNGPSFQEYHAIQPNISDTMRLTNISDIANELEQPLGYEDVWFTLTFKNDVRVMNRAVELHDALVEEMKVLSDTGDFSTLCMFQPLPTIFAERAAEQGGNILGLDRLSGNSILWLASLSVKGAEQATIANEKVAAWTNAVEAYAKSIDANEDYRFVNYANGILQDPLSSYGPENVAKIRAAAAKYDPVGVFQKQVPGGFKISKIPENKVVKDEL